jgi:hypothetical protein
MLVVPLSEREFNLYALTLPKGPNFDPFVFRSGWKSEGDGSVGAVLIDPEAEQFGILVGDRSLKISPMFLRTVMTRIPLRSDVSECDHPKPPTFRPTTRTPER